MIAPRQADQQHQRLNRWKYNYDLQDVVIKERAFKE